jgi:hypothetical protein
MYVSCFNTIQATRCCPFNCEYCAVSAFFGRKYRTRPVAEVIDEIRRFDTRDFLFVDDNITGQASYAKELFKALVPLNRTWGGQITINIAKDEELLSLYAKIGGKYSFIGFETLSEKNLTKMNKSWNSPDAYKEAIKKYIKQALTSLAVSSLDSMKMTLQFLKKLLISLWKIILTQLNFISLHLFRVQVFIRQWRPMEG